MNTQISIWEVFALLFLHWVFDFVAQSDKQAKNKATSWKWLLTHTGFYSWFFLVFAFGYSVLTHNWSMLLFAPITFAAHTATDYYTSKVNSQLWKDGKTHEFFVSIGFDQLLHAAQLIITFQILK